jgi:hypothetical protein
LIVGAALLLMRVTTSFMILGYPGLATAQARVGLIDR